MTSALERVLGSSLVTHAAFCAYTEAKQKLKANQAGRRLAALGRELLPVDRIRFQPRPDQTECHIIGSGWSLNTSAPLAQRPEAYVVGFNSAVLSGLRFDSYSLEFAGPGYAELGDHQVRVARILAAQGKCQTFFKNLCLPHNSVDVAVEKFGDLVVFVRDICLTCLSTDQLPRVVDRLLCNDKRYLRQYMSTALALIGLARASGFRKIVLHGVDFGGDYFFDAPNFTGDRSLRPPPVSGIYAKGAKPGGHATNKPGLGLQALLPLLRDRLSQENILLCAATNESPSSRILSVL